MRCHLALITARIPLRAARRDTGRRHAFAAAFVGRWRTQWLPARAWEGAEA